MTKSEIIGLDAFAGMTLGSRDGVAITGAELDKSLTDSLAVGTKPISVGLYFINNFIKETRKADTGREYNMLSFQAVEIDPTTKKALDVSNVSKKQLTSDRATIQALGLVGKNEKELVNMLVGNFIEVVDRYNEKDDKGVELRNEYGNPIVKVIWKFA